MDVRENAINALRSLPIRPEDVKMASSRSRSRSNWPEDGRSSGYGVRAVEQGQQEWVRQRRPGRTTERTSGSASSPNGSTRGLATLPRYSHLKGLGLS